MTLCLLMMLYLCPIAVDVHFDHIYKVVLASFFPWRSLPFVMNKYLEILWDY